MVGGTDPAEHEELVTVGCSACEDNLFCCVGFARSSLVARVEAWICAVKILATKILDAYRLGHSAVAKNHFRDERVYLQRQRIFSCIIDSVPNVVPRTRAETYFIYVRPASKYCRSLISLQIVGINISIHESFERGRSSGSSGEICSLCCETNRIWLIAHDPGGIS